MDEEVNRTLGNSEQRETDEEERQTRRANDGYNIYRRKLGIVRCMRTKVGNGSFRPSQTATLFGRMDGTVL